MKMVITPPDGSSILRTVIFSHVQNVAANIAEGEVAFLVSEDLGEIDDARLCVADFRLALRDGVEGAVQHVGEQALPHTFSLWG